MVPTTSLNPDLAITVSSLEMSEFDEDKEIAKDFANTLKALVMAILPIIKYVDEPIGQVRGVVVGKMQSSPNLEAVLGRDGKWHDLLPGANSTDIKPNELAWKQVLFSELCDGLNTAIRKATEKKQEHLDALAQRRAMLGSINALIHQVAPPK